MKHPGYSRVVDILRERELELFAIRSNYEQLQNKFFQLENAFRINLNVQKRLESELALCKPGKAPKKSSRKSDEKVKEKKSKARAVLFSRLTKIRNEKSRWKEAFYREKKMNERQKHEHENVIDIIKKECEEILKNCRETGENHFRELLKLYEGSSGKVRYLEVAINDFQIRASTTCKRILELANLLETLEKFQGVRTETVCQRVAKALRSLATEEEENSYENDMRNLRQVTWDLNENDNNEQIREFLQAQNSVLREVVKSLKRKLNERNHEVGMNDENMREAKKNNDEENLMDFGWKENIEKSHVKSEESRNIFLCRESEDGEKVEETGKSVKSLSKESGENEKSECDESSGECRISGFCTTSLSNEITTNSREWKKTSKQSHKNDVNPKKIYVDAFESHKNGIPYVEYAIHICDQRKIRVRQSKILTVKNSRMIVEFVDNEMDFESAPIDRTIFYLGDNIEKIVRIKDSGVNCGVQTNRVRKIEKFVQTTITGTSGFSKINTGVGILNSEKRAIERSLANLENTVTSLKSDALGQARSMIQCDAKILADDFFNCMKRLES